jgi:hypothetical protein
MFNFASAGHPPVTNLGPPTTLCNQTETIETKPGARSPPCYRRCKHMVLSASKPSTPSALTFRQAKVVLELAQGATITAAAAAAGVNRCTIHRWLNTPKFAEAVRLARAATILALRDESKDLIVRARATVDSLLADPQTPAAERLRLALDILHRAI